VGSLTAALFPHFFTVTLTLLKTSLINGLTMPACNPCVNNVDTKEIS
jgi:hypothetical protein